MAHASTEKSEQGASILRDNEHRGPLFITRKLLTRPYMSPEASTSFRVINNSGRVVSSKRIYMFTCMTVSVFVSSGTHL